MHRITIEDFCKLKDWDKVQLLEDQGVCLDVARYSGNYKIGLFDLHGFYVEVWVDKKTGFISRMRAFDVLKHLDPYLSFVNIQSALNSL